MKKLLLLAGLRKYLLAQLGLVVMRMVFKVLKEKFGVSKK